MAAAGNFADTKRHGHRAHHHHHCIAWLALMHCASPVVPAKGYPGAWFIYFLRWGIRIRGGGDSTGSSSFKLIFAIIFDTKPAACLNLLQNARLNVSHSPPYAAHIRAWKPPRGHIVREHLSKCGRLLGLLVPQGQEAGGGTAGGRRAGY